MGSEHNRLRRKWQDYGGGNAAAAERAFFDSFQKVFQDTEYRIRANPKEFQKIYVDFPLPDFPTMDTNSPRLIIKSTPLRTVNSPAALEKRLMIPRISMIASGVASCTRCGAAFGVV